MADDPVIMSHLRLCLSSSYVVASCCPTTRHIFRKIECRAQQKKHARSSVKRVHSLDECSFDLIRRYTTNALAEFCHLRAPDVIESFKGKDNLM